MFDDLKNGGEQQRMLQQGPHGKCPPQVFPRFTSECIQNLRAKILSVGFDPPEGASGNASGEASRAGFRIRWTYDSESQALTIQCIASPFYAPCKVVMAEIERWVRECYRPGLQESSVEVRTPKAERETSNKS